MNTLSVKHFLATCKIQKIEFLRDRGGVFLNFVFPLFFAVSLVVNNYSSTSFTLEFGVVDQHANAQAQPFVEALTANVGIEATSYSLAEARKLLQEGTLHALVLLPEGDFVKGENQVQLQVIPRYEEFVKLIMEAVRTRLLEQGQQTEQGILEFVVQQPDEEVRSEFSFTYPGILALALLQLALFGTAVPLLQAKDRGTLRYMLLTPLKTLELLCAQLAVRFVIAMMQVGLLLAVGMFILDLNIVDWAAVIGVALLGILMLISIGYVIAGMATNLQIGMAIVLVSNFTMAFLGNVFWDPSGSGFTQYISYLIPLTYLSDMFRQVITGNAGMLPLWVDAAVILAISLVAIGIAIRTFRFDNQLRSA